MSETAPQRHQDHSGNILYRLGIPIIGITDGDCDNVTCETKIFPALKWTREQKIKGFH
ncbi:DUF2117 domain-containing protein [Methanosarcina acetivorans]|uniref:DUF2117 domain-containing protein n=1 Tax=Methanosarcina acetivorans TaxID=2214 RepID=UPI00373AEBF5